MITSSLFYNNFIWQISSYRKHIYSKYTLIVSCVFHYLRHHFFTFSIYSFLFKSHIIYYFITKQLKSLFFVHLWFLFKQHWLRWRLCKSTCMSSLVGRSPLEARVYISIFTLIRFIQFTFTLKTATAISMNS